MPWIPAPFRIAFPAWLISSTGTEPYSFKPIAKEIGKDYALAAVAVQTSYGGIPPLTVGTALDIQKGFEKSFEKLETYMNDVVSWAPGDSPTEWGMEVPDEVWLDAATSVVKYWSGGIMSPLPPPPPGSVGTNPILFPGYTINTQTNLISVNDQLTKDISAAFKLYNGLKLGKALDKAFVDHLKLVAGTWTGVILAPPAAPVPLVFPWVGLS
jgi:hypothetical protein